MDTATAQARLHQLISQVAPHYTAEQRHLVAAQLPITCYPKGKRLLHEGATRSCCYYVLQGCIREYATIGDEERSTHFFLEGDFAYDATSFNGHGEAAASWVCEEDCALLVGSHEGSASVLEVFPDLAGRIQGMESAAFGQMRKTLLHFQTSTPAQRLAHLMATHPEWFQRIPQYHIASYLGITPVSLSRLKRRMQ